MTYFTNFCAFTTFKNTGVQRYALTRGRIPGTDTNTKYSYIVKLTSNMVFLMSYVAFSMSYVVFSMSYVVFVIKISFITTPC